MSKLNKNSLILASATYFLLACSATQTSAPKLTKVEAVQPKVIKASQSIATNKQPNVLTLEQIMSDPDWMGRQPTSAFWSDNSQSVYYQQKQQGTLETDLWEKTLSEKGNGNKIALSQLHLHAYKNRVINHKKDMAAWVFEGNIFVKNLANNNLKQLTKDNRQPYNLVFLTDGRLSFQSGNTIYAIHPEQGLYEQLITWQFADEPIAVEEPDDYIAQQQQQLIEVVALKRQQKKQRFDKEQKVAQQNKTLAPTDFYFPEGNETVKASLSPNGKWLVLVVQEEEDTWRDDGDIMPNYINENGRIATDDVRRRVADSSPGQQSIWLVNL